jgi:5-formyltetrahydrofolate cyclo-ligase
MESMTKDDFRKECIEKLTNNTNILRYYKDRRIIKKIQEVIKVEKPVNILLYIALGIEVNIMPLLNELRKNKKYNLFVPYMIGKTLKIVPYRLPLMKKKYNIKEPNNSYFKYKVNIDLAIVPIIGTDNSFRRIGFGVGFYDRFFSSLKYTPKIIFTQRCLCKSKNILTQEHDIKADYIITNKGTIWNK